MDPPYLDRHFRCPNSDCSFAEQPPSQPDPRGAQHCTRRLFAHLDESKHCLQQAGYAGAEDFKKVSSCLILFTWLPSV